MAYQQGLVPSFEVDSEHEAQTPFDCPDCKGKFPLYTPCFYLTQRKGWKGFCLCDPCGIAFARSELEKQEELFEEYLETID